MLGDSEQGIYGPYDPWLYEVYILVGDRKEYIFYLWKEENLNSFEVEFSGCQEKSAIKE